MLARIFSESETDPRERLFFQTGNDVHPGSVDKKCHSIDSVIQLLKTVPLLLVKIQLIRNPLNSASDFIGKIQRDKSRADKNCCSYCFHTVFLIHPVFRKYYSQRPAIHYLQKRYCILTRKPGNQEDGKSRKNKLITGNSRTPDRFLSF